MQTLVQACRIPLRADRARVRIRDAGEGHRPLALHGHDEGKLLPLLTLRTTSPAISAAGLASADAVARADELLRQFAAHADSMLSGPRIFQLWGNRAATGGPP